MRHFFSKELFYFLILLTFILSFTGFYSMYESLPYYMRADMDHTTALDTFVINSNLIPSHIHHPGFGMYLILKSTLVFNQIWSGLPSFDFTSMSQSLSPLSILAQRTDQIRFTSVFIALFSLFFLWMFVRKLFIQSKTFLGFITLLTIVSQFSFWKHSGFNRTEFYALFFWTMALFILSYIPKCKNKKNIITYIILIGFFVGLSFLTKFQLLILLLIPVVSAPFLNKNIFNKVQNKILFYSIWIFNFIFFALSTLASLFIKLNEGYGSFAKNWHPNIFLFLLATLLLGLPTIVFFYEKNNQKMLNLIVSISHYFNLLLFGFFLSFFTHFLIYSDIFTSLKYMFIDFKVLFVRHTYAMPGGDSHYAISQSLLDNFIALIQISPQSFVFLIFSTICFLFINFKKEKIFFNSTNSWALLIFSILLLNDFVAVRATPRDLLLHEIPTNLFSMILTILNIKTFDSKKMYYLKSFSLLIPVFLLIYFNSKQSLNYIFSPFKGTLNEESFFHNTYAGPRTPYQQIVNTFYGSELYSKKRTEDKLFSRYFKQHINAVKHSLDLNAKPNLRYIGPFAEGRQVSLFNDFKNFKLLNLPNSYKEPIVYDFLSDLTSQNRVSFKLHPRPDIQTALYSANLEHWKSFRQKDCLFEEAPDVVLKSDIQTRTIKGFYIYGSRCEISVAKLDLQNLSFLVLDAHNLSILSKHRKPAKGTIPTEW